MPDLELTGWLLLAFGLYSLAASLGELRNPGQWKAMVEGLNDSYALSFLAGLVVFSLGFAIALAHPLDLSADPRAVIVSFIAYGMIIEGITFFAFPRSMSAFATRLLSAASPLWVIISALLGLIAIVAAFPLLPF
ncbi:hypothetical protein [Sphingomicrobium lutaoense]|uniref:Uncharacterized protein YjeT (DUF2065 family) n=1 Tax=Sphingomicrobium lutaoense TaxID=515949 RepID=A0A839Z239_9SPHN|nr:hypothetical protein [Sphingomicrobium lutaoense]MBB3764710.1 uncharacterized protein YjeT (DUF2065 family) [Sphingomicrobium lutaoense]